MSGEFWYRLKSLVACAVSSFLQDIKHVHIHVFVSRAHPSLQVLSFWASTTTSALVSRAWEQVHVPIVFKKERQRPRCLSTLAPSCTWVRDSCGERGRGRQRGGGGGGRLLKGEADALTPFARITSYFFAHTFLLVAEYRLNGERPWSSLSTVLRVQVQTLYSCTHARTHPRTHYTIMLYVSCHLLDHLSIYHLQYHLPSIINRSLITCLCSNTSTP